MGNVRLRIQVDFGVGDVMVPGPRLIEYPVFMNAETIELLAYPIESALAEKLQAMVALGNANSRMKDFYDVWICSTHLGFEAEALLGAMAATFENRRTPVPEEIFAALTASFVAAHAVQWNAFVKKIGEHGLIDKFSDVVADIEAFAMPLMRALVRAEKSPRQWKPGIGWDAVRPRSG